MSTEIDPNILLEQAPDSVIYADLEGFIRTWNKASERIFGHAAEEALGQSLDLIIPDQYRDAHWTGYDRALEAGETKYTGQSLPTKARHKDGHDIYVELSFAIVKSADGTVTGALAHARDITERFTQDRETRRRLRALEAELKTLRGSDEPVDTQVPAATPDVGR